MGDAATGGDTLRRRQLVPLRGARAGRKWDNYAASRAAAQNQLGTTQNSLICDIVK
jgi:hypothetical protein